VRKCPPACSRSRSPRLFPSRRVALPHFRLRNRYRRARAGAGERTGGCAKRAHTANTLLLTYLCVHSWLRAFRFGGWASSGGWLEVWCAECGRRRGVALAARAPRSTKRDSLDQTRRADKTGSKEGEERWKIRVVQTVQHALISQAHTRFSSFLGTLGRVVGRRDFCVDRCFGGMRGGLSQWGRAGASGE
jgi:hypothetical protein